MNGDAGDLEPRRFWRWILVRYQRTLIATTLCLGLYSGYMAIRLMVLGLAADVAIHQVKLKEAVANHLDPALVEKGKILASFEKGWTRIFAGEPPTAHLEEPFRFYRFLIVFSLAAILISLAVAVAIYFKEYLAQKIVTQITAEVRQRIVDHLVTQSLAFFHHQKTGDLLSRVTNDVVTMNLSLRMVFETLVQDPITIVSACAVMFYNSWRLSLIVLPFYLLLFVPIFRAGRKVRRYGRGSLEKFSEVTEDLQQLFTGFRTVKAFSMEAHERADFREKNRAYVNKQLKMSRAKSLGRTLQEGAYNIGVVVFLFLIGCLLYSEISRLDTGTLTVFIFCIIQLYQPIKGITKALNQIQESKGGYERILELLRTSPRIQDAPDAIDFPGLAKEIRFGEVGFAYDPRNPLLPAPGDGTEAAHVLRGINLEVRAGEVVALVGPSGAGKSTLVDLLARFHDPTEGRILVDGKDIRSFRHASYLRAIAIVSQDPFLFNATIAENIAYGREGASRAEVEAAARQALAHDFILEQPQGYETRIGERGVKLSGGQRQRITIARAILKAAPILILDEATSALDSASEKEVQKALENLMAGSTTFIIAHRLSTITHAGKIVVLQEGRIVESGTHAELLERRGSYWALHRLQEGA